MGRARACGTAGLRANVAPSRTGNAHLIFDDETSLLFEEYVENGTQWSLVATIHPADLELGSISLPSLTEPALARHQQRIGSTSTLRVSAGLVCGV